MIEWYETYSKTNKLGILPYSVLNFNTFHYLIENNELWLLFWDMYDDKDILTNHVFILIYASSWLFEIILRSVMLVHMIGLSNIEYRKTLR